MPAFMLTRDEAVRIIAEVENALFDGAPVFPRRHSHQMGVYGVVSNRLNIPDQTIRGWVGTPASRYSTIRANHNLEVDWSMYRPDVAPAPPAFGGHEQLPPSVHPHDRKWVLLQDENKDLRAKLREAHKASSTDEIIRELVGNIVDADRDPPSWITAPPERKRMKPTPEVPVTIWSDWHIGEVVEKAEVNGFNYFNMAVAEERVERLIDSTISLCRNNHVGVYAGIVVNLLGDFISGGIHPELKATDEEEVIPASLKAADWLVAGLERMACEFKRVYVPCATGNHGRTTVKPEFKRYYRKNFDWLIIQIVAKHFAKDKRFHFDMRPSNDVHYQVFNERYLACHGDMLGVRGGDGIIGSIGPIVRGEVKQSGQSSALGLGFDKLLIGHWHQRLWLPRAIVNNALKGFDEYAMKALGAKPDHPTQALWFVHPTRGKTASWDVHLGDQPEPAKEWVKWKSEIK